MRTSTATTSGLPPASHPSIGSDEAGAVVRCAAAETTAAIVAGDRTAYIHLFEARCDFIEREAARRLGRRRDLVDDVAQESWLRIARAPRQCPDERSLDAWLRAIVRTAALDILRSELARRVREERFARERQEATAYLADLDMLDGLRSDLAALDGLSMQERALMELKSRTGATLREFAAMLGIGRAAADSALRRAAERAKRLLEDEARRAGEKELRS